MDALIQGGPIVVVILILSVAAWFLVARKIMHLSSKERFDKDSSDIALRFLDSGDIEQAKQSCHSTRTLVGRVLLGAIIKWESCGSISRSQKNEIVRRESHVLREHTAIITSAGTVMLLLGLLGTVLGIIKTFHGMSLGSTSDVRFLIASGISQALLTTQTGLICAVPILISNAAISSVVRKRLDSIEIVLKRLDGIVNSGEISVRDNKQQAK